MSWVSECADLAAALNTSESRAANVAKFWPWLDEAAEREGLSPELVAGVVWVESRFNSRATSPKGARGLMQVMPATHDEIAKRLGVDGDPYDPRLNLRVGTWFLRRLLDRFPDRRDAITAYNAGAGNVSRHGADRWAHYYDAVVSATARFTSAKKTCQGLTPYPTPTPPSPYPKPAKRPKLATPARSSRTPTRPQPNAHAPGGASPILLGLALLATQKGAIPPWL